MFRSDLAVGPPLAGSFAPPPDRASLVSREPMHGKILPHIRHDIVTGRWKPGERLSEPALCREFKVSRTPLRDALRLLETEGLVRLIPHVGAVVTEASDPDIGEKMQLLTAIEQFAAYMVAAEGSPATIDNIVALHEKMAAAASGLQSETYYQLNDDFHRAIVVGTGNQTLAASHEQVMWHVYRARHMANADEPLSRNAATHHAAIVDAICARDGDEAQTAMRSHLLDVTQIILRQFSGVVARSHVATR